MNKEILTPAAKNGWVFALLMVIFVALWIIPLSLVPILGDLIRGGVFVSFLFLAVYMRDAAYAFEGGDRVAMKDVALGFALMLAGLIAEEYGTPLTPTAVVWDLAFAVLFLLGGLKIMGAFGKLATSSVFDNKAAGTLKLAGIFFIVAAALGVLFAFLSFFWIIFKIFLLVAAIVFLVGWGKIKNA